MNGIRRDALDDALASLPREAEPTRDLWPGISAAIAAESASQASAPSAGIYAPSHRWYQLAAAVVLVIASSVTTYWLTRDSIEREVIATRQTVPQSLAATTALPAMPVSFAGQALGTGYQQARADLDARFEQHLASLPPVTRAKLERNLADLRRAANEIAASLAEHPSDALLQELLLSTYQSELQMLADVNEMTTATSMRADL